jgi:hypothetical protein
LKGAVLFLSDNPAHLSNQSGICEPPCELSEGLKRGSTLVRFSERLRKMLALHLIAVGLYKSFKCHDSIEARTIKQASLTKEAGWLFKG